MWAPVDNVHFLSFKLSLCALNFFEFIKQLKLTCMNEIKLFQLIDRPGGEENFLYFWGCVQLIKFISVGDDSN